MHPRKNVQGRRATKARSSKIPKSSALLPGPSAFSLLEMKSPLFPLRARKSMFYYDHGFEQTSTSGAKSTIYSFSANALFDPDITGTGHQPLGFDTMMTYYEQYTVLGSKITFTCLSALGIPIRVTAYLNPDTTSQGITESMENGLNKSFMLTGPYGVSPTHGKLMNLSCDITNYFGRKRSSDIVNDTELSGTVAANPAEQVYYSIVSWSAVNATTSTNGWDVVIEYDAVFWEPKKAAAQLPSPRQVWLDYKASQPTKILPGVLKHGKPAGQGPAFMEELYALHPGK